MFKKLSKWLQNAGGSDVSTRSQKNLQSAPPAPPETQDEWYRVLEVAPGSDLKTVRAAWKRQLARHHRDLLSEDVETKRRATLATNRINAAYRALQDILS